MLSCLYKEGDELKNANTFEVNNQEKTTINPEFSQYCQTKLNQNESILEDMKEKYPEIIPIIDENFCRAFIEYVKREGPDCDQLSLSLIQINASILLQNHFMECLLNKTPQSFNLIFELFKKDQDESFSSFEFHGGHYELAKFSMNEEFKLIISSILQLIIDQSIDYSLPFFPPGDLFQKEFDETENVDFTYSMLIDNLLSSENEQVINETLKALQVGFANPNESQAIECCVYLGHLFLNKYFQRCIDNPNLQDEAFNTLSIGLPHIPLFNPEAIANIMNELLLIEDSIKNTAGIRLCKILIQYLSGQHDYLDMPDVIPKNAFENFFLQFEIFPKLFTFTSMGSYKQKILSFQTIDLFIQFCQPPQLLYLLEIGLFTIFDENFVDERIDTSPERSILISTLELLNHTLQKVSKLKLPPECFQQLQVYFKYIEYLKLNSDDVILDYLQKNKNLEFFIQIYKESEEES